MTAVSSIVCEDQSTGQHVNDTTEDITENQQSRMARKEKEKKTGGKYTT